MPEVKEFLSIQRGFRTKGPALCKLRGLGFSVSTERIKSLIIKINPLGQLMHAMRTHMGTFSLKIKIQEKVKTSARREKLQRKFSAEVILQV